VAISAASHHPAARTLAKHQLKIIISGGGVSASAAAAWHQWRKRQLASAKASTRRLSAAAALSSWRKRLGGYRRRHIGNRGGNLAYQWRKHRPFGSKAAS
jgi:hypothetical protein